jgi:hypothetical protein
MVSIRRYFSEALELADEATSPREGLWHAVTGRLAFLSPRDIPESIRDRFEMWRKAATFENDDPAGVGTARLTAEGMSDADARELLDVLRQMAIAIGAVDAGAFLPLRVHDRLKR